MMLRLVDPIARIGVVLLIIAASASARHEPPERADASVGYRSGAAQAVTDPLYRIQSNPALRATVTNWGGYFGNQGGLLIDSAAGDSLTAVFSPNFESPPFSGIEYLFEAGLWIGGVVAGDTLVSVATTGWAQTHEIYPADATPPVFSDLLGDEEFTVAYADTLTDPAVVSDDPIDGAHRPLSVHVDQTTRLVDDPAFQHGLIVEITVRNIGALPIEGLHIGWHVDSDIGHLGISQRFLHDLSGYRRSAVVIDGQEYDVGVAWSADNDGDPADSVRFGDSSATRVFGSAFLGSNPPLAEESFNWWIPGYRAAADWGPQQAPADTNVRGGTGRPMGDAMKYRFMANGEIDYEQVFAAVDRTDEGWTPPTDAAIAEIYADGSDTRFLHSVGSTTLFPGDSLTTAWAFLIAPRWHTDPAHFESSFDPAAPELYLAGLGMAALDTVAARMHQLYESGFADALIGAPRVFRVAGWDDYEARLSWQPRGTARFGSYEILRSVVPGVFADPAIVTLAQSDSAFTDTDLERNILYYYTIQSVTDDGRPGPHAAAVDVLPDRPMTPTGLSTNRANARIDLAWDAALEADVTGHRVYRRRPDEDWSFVGETGVLPVYSDATAENAVVYQYQVAALSALGNESFRSDPVRGLAFAFDDVPLLLDHTLADPTGLTDKDSVRAVWESLLGPAALSYRDADPATVGPFGLEAYNAHPIAIVTADGRFPLRPEAKEQLFLYMEAGGRALLTGRDLFNEQSVTEGTVEFGPGSFGFDKLGITAARYPRVLLSHPTRMNAEFVAATAAQPGWPDLVVDSARTDWGLNPALPSTEGAIPFVGYFAVDSSRADVLYTFVSNQPETSLLHGKPVAVRLRGDDARIVAFAFPLSYMEEDGTRRLVVSILGEFGWQSTRPGDVDGNATVDLADVNTLIAYLYHGGALLRPGNADVIGTAGRTDLLDAMAIRAFVLLGTPLPADSH